jgi:hypothetical protein
MTSGSSTQAENTIAFLQEAQRNGSPAPIPGAFEMRASVPAAPLTQGIDVRVRAHAPAGADSDPERVEHERREGGGAPSQRAGRHRGTISARLWQSVLHPMQLAAIWRRVALAA